MQGAPLVVRLNTEVFSTAFRMTRAPLIEDGMSPDRVARTLGDPAAAAELELERETRNRGRFRRLNLD